MRPAFFWLVRLAGVAPVQSKLKVPRIRYKTVGALSQVCDAQTQGIGVDASSRETLSARVLQIHSWDAALNAGGGAEPTHGLTFSSKQNFEDRRMWDSTVCPSTRVASKCPETPSETLLKPCPPTYLQILYHDPGEAPAHETAGPRAHSLRPLAPCIPRAVSDAGACQARWRVRISSGPAYTRDQPACSPRGHVDRA